MRFTGLIKVCSFSFLSLIIIASCGGLQSSPTTDSSTPANKYAGVIRDITSADLVAEMGVGWNLGNSYDVRDSDKTKWGNPLPNKAQINSVKAMGFNTIRIPITWNYNMQSNPPFKVDQSYFARIKNTVNGAIDNNMHVIINVHHDESWVRPTFDDAEAVKLRLSALWTQIANEFISYGDSLIFETLNEPRLKGTPEEWSGGTAEGREVLNQFHKVSVDAIRATGGNNEKRHLMVSTYAASTNTNAMNELEVPNNDQNVIISLHSYFPWSFAGQEGGSTTWGTDQEVRDLEAELDRVKLKWLVQEKRAVVMGEWGSIDRSNIKDRVNYAAHYVKACMERGLLPIVWDDGGDFQILDRNTYTWKYPDLAKIIVSSAK